MSCLRDSHTTPHNSLQKCHLRWKCHSIDGRHGRRSTVLVTNVDFEAWSEYLGDPPLAMAFLDRLVDGATVLKLRGRSYRAARARTVTEDKEEASQSK